MVIVLLEILPKPSNEFDSEYDPAETLCNAPIL